MLHWQVIPGLLWVFIQPRLLTAWVADNLRGVGDTDRRIAPVADMAEEKPPGTPAWRHYKAVIGKLGFGPAPPLGRKQAARSEEDHVEPIL